MKQIFIAIPLITLFFLLTLFTGIFEDSFLFQSIAIIASSIILIPLYFDKMPRKWSFLRKLRTHFVFAIAVVSLLNVGYFFRAGVMKERAYDYQFGHLSGPFRTIYATLPFQFVIDQIYQQLPLDYRVSIYQFEDVARMRSINQEVSDNFVRELLCYEKDRKTCFMKIVKETAVKHPPGTAGTVVLYEQGSDILKSEKNELLEFGKIIGNLSERPDTVITQYVPGFPESSVTPELQVILRKEQKIRDLLSKIHHPKVKKA